MQKNRVEEWKKGFEASLKKSPDGEKELKTLSGIPIKCIYTSEDLKEFDDDCELGLPGEYPYTRGIYHSMYRGQTWTKRFLVGHQSPETFNARQKEMLNAGQSGINFTPCNSYWRGYDSDAVDKTLLGRCGTTIDSLKDVEIAFDGITLDQISLGMNDFAPFMMVASIIALAEEKHIPASCLQGTTNQSDFISHYVSCNQPIRFGMDGHLKIMIDHVKYCTKHMPKWHPVSVIGKHYRESGATPVQSMAFALASAIFYVDTFIKAGLRVDDFAPRFSFFFDASGDLFEEVAKFRAARRMWAKVMKERFGAENPKSCILRFHVQTSGTELARQQPINNVVRASLHTLSAILGGAQSIHTNAYDEPLWIPTSRSQRIAIMTQNIIAEETGVANVIDPLGGSYYVESLTNKVEEIAWDYIDIIEKRGGMFKATKEGFIQKEIDKISYEYQKEVDSGEKIVVGLNKYVVKDEEEPPEQVKVDPELIEKQINRTKNLKKNRNQKKAAEALKRIREAATDPQKNVFEAVIDAVKADVTNGEMVGELRDVYGFGRPLLI
ncbi:MAG: methylmalonyl-CoA mutase family protein [Thermodesulfobacteriota bacterium]